MLTDSAVPAQLSPTGGLTYRNRCQLQHQHISVAGTGEYLPRSECGLRRLLEQHQPTTAPTGTRNDFGNVTNQTFRISEQELVRRLCETKANRILICGEGGSGKTELARALAHELASSQGNALPVHFELRQWRTTADLFAFIAGADSSSIEIAARSAQLVFILDGLDELRFDPTDFGVFA